MSAGIAIGGILEHLLGRPDHHDRDAARGAIDTRTPGGAEHGGIFNRQDNGRVAADGLGGDVGGEDAEVDEASVRREGLVPEATCIVADDIYLAQPDNKAGENSDVGANGGTRPDVYTSQRLYLPHGGRQTVVVVSRQMP